MAIYRLTQPNLDLENPTLEIIGGPENPKITGVNIALMQYDLEIRLTTTHATVLMNLTGVQAASLNFSSANIEEQVWTRLQDYLVTP